jgi:hypothetical protein
VSNSRLIIPIDPASLTEQQFHLLKRDMKILEPGQKSMN